MKKIATALAGAALLATLAVPGAAVVARSSNVFRNRYAQPDECSRHRRSERRGNCYDEHEPQHDGNGSILY